MEAAYCERGRRVKIPIAKPYFSEAEVEAVTRVLQSGWVSQGPVVAEFEEAFARYVGTRYAVAVSSCTAALHLALLASGIGRGDEVLVPALTFVATANAVEHCGATAVFVDVDPGTLNIDAAQIESKITPRTRALIPVHLFGLSADMGPIHIIAQRHSLCVIEDAACAVGSRYRGRHVGTFGSTACFSFHPRKVITTGEGGMITSDDARIVETLRSLRSHGAGISDLQRHRSGEFVLPAFTTLGYNYRMTDVQAAIGLAQMAKLDEILERRMRLAEAYTAAFAEIDCLQVPTAPPGYVHAFQSYVIQVRGDGSVSRDTLAQQLAARGIATRQGTHAVPALDYYRNRHGFQPRDYPVAWAADRQTLTLPLYYQMGSDDRDCVIEAVRGVVSSCRTRIA